MVEPQGHASAPEGTRDHVSNPADLPRGTLVDLFYEGLAKNRPNAQQRYTPAGWQPISHEQLYADVRRLAQSLRTLGVQRGDKVILLAENRPEWPLADYAILCMGALSVPIYPTLPATQLGYILRHSGARVALVSTAEQLAKTLEARAKAPELASIVVFDDVESAEPGVVTLRQLTEQEAHREQDEAAFRAEALRAQPDDVATIIYTSGTTGDPKGVMLTHENIYSNVRSALAFVLDIGPNDQTFSCLPLSHVLQRMVDYAFFFAGVPIAYVPQLELVAQALREVRPTIAVLVPRMYEKLYARILAVTGVKRLLVMWAREVALEYAEVELAGGPVPRSLAVRHRVADALVFRKLRALLGGRVRFFVSGSAPLAPQIQKFFYGAGVLILEGYGLTETSPVTNVNRPQENRIGTVGKPIPGTEIRIAGDGEILVRGPQVMRGYYRNDEATAAAIDPDGWFHTGDIGTIDGDGYLRITDRKKDLLVTAGGKNIAPQPIQNAAKTSRFVAEALLIGDRRPYPILLVVPNFESLKTWAKLHDIHEDVDALIRDPRVRERVRADVETRLGEFARYELPKKVLLLPREFSLERGEITPSLKVKRKVVEEHYAAEIEALYAEPAGETGGASPRAASA